MEPTVFIEFFSFVDGDGKNRRLPPNCTASAGKEVLSNALADSFSFLRKARYYRMVFSTLLDIINTVVNIIRATIGATTLVISMRNSKKEK